MFARKFISRKACSPTRSENASRPLVLIYRQRCVCLYVIFITLEIMESCGEAGNTTVIGTQLYFTSVEQRYKHGGHVVRVF